jgi:hypothetical protein
MKTSARLPYGALLFLRNPLNRHGLSGFFRRRFGRYGSRYGNRAFLEQIIESVAESTEARNGMPFNWKLRCIPPIEQRRLRGPIHRAKPINVARFGLLKTHAWIVQNLARIAHFFLFLARGSLRKIGESKSLHICGILRVRWARWFPGKDP